MIIITVAVVVVMMQLPAAHSRFIQLERSPFGWAELCGGGVRGGSRSANVVAGTSREPQHLRRIHDGHPRAKLESRVAKFELPGWLGT